jgi:phosphoserine phosphatase RsbU/P
VHGGVCVRLVPGEQDATVEIARGGHPPPFLLRAGEPAEPIGRPGPLLGGFAGGDWDVARHTLGAGESLVLYTDGVTDARGTDDRFGFERLAGVLTEASALGADEIAGRVDAALLAHQAGDQHDDVALLVLRVGDRSPRAVALAGPAGGRARGSRGPLAR